MSLDNNNLPLRGIYAVNASIPELGAYAFDYDNADAPEEMGQVRFDDLVRILKVTPAAARIRLKQVLYESACARQFAHALTTEFAL